MEQPFNYKQTQTTVTKFPALSMVVITILYSVDAKRMVSNYPIISEHVAVNFVAQ